MPQCPLPDVIDVSEKAWPTRAFENLKVYGCARVKLTATEAKIVTDLYDSMEAVSQDRKSEDELEVPKDEFNNLDARSGYVWFEHRSFFEMHCDSDSIKRLEKMELPPAKRLVKCAWDYSHMCDTRLLEALQHIANEQPRCASLLEEGKRADGKKLGDGIIQNMLRVYRYSETYDKPDGDIDAHYDMGLLTMIARSTSAGLQIQVHGSSEWMTPEDYMEKDEALIFGGLTLARLTGIPALHHGVFTNGKVRFSAPWFQRVATHAVIPASPGCPEETIKSYNRRLRDASNDELRCDGSIVQRPRQRRSDSRRRRSKSRSRSDSRRRRNNSQKWPSDGGYGQEGKDNYQSDPKNRGRSDSRRRSSNTNSYNDNRTSGDFNPRSKECSRQWQETSDWNRSGDSGYNEDIRGQ